MNIVVRASNKVELRKSEPATATTTESGGREQGREEQEETNFTRVYDFSIKPAGKWGRGVVGG